jgi:hypothetical protein
VEGCTCDRFTSFDRYVAWCRDEVLRCVLTDVTNELRDRGMSDEQECFIDATFVMAKGGGSEIGPTKRGKGMKIIAIVDRHGLPLSHARGEPSKAVVAGAIARPSMALRRRL